MCVPVGAGSGAALFYGSAEPEPKEKFTTPQYWANGAFIQARISLDFQDRKFLQFASPIAEKVRVR
jgi:hypothetical protein